ncbi:hypothetical protein GKIL_2852 [Gloeobacter kilaueensis JS1]|uniref:Uncharacterized protein n=1 Tax=Gloeobacter kilaueensis (strain ATCC BAA-2537 / CCAP 1431/1 / ULC 316 / JS1) TaxID=1183438 RepID=U5QJN2_GLOK1|nr:hypothetical protein GKIL_2852 [Gloeobacter kilaueensis JS1]
MFIHSSKSSLVSGLALAGSLMLIEAVSQPLPIAAQTLIYGSGDSFPAALYRTWFDCYGTPLSTTSKPAGCTTSQSFKYYYAATSAGGLSQSGSL